MSLPSVSARMVDHREERREIMTALNLSILKHPASPEALRRLPIGAEPQSGGGVHFRLWAPRCREVVVEIEGLEPAMLQSEPDGYFSAWSQLARAGMRYLFRLDQGETALPDPASRFQPEGPHGPSEIIDPEDFAWTDGAWRGVPRERLVIYEMHIGTFTPEGSWDAALRELAGAVVRQVRSAGRGRTTFVVGENEPQQAKLVRPAERGGYGLDALWNDDFHHSATVALTGRHEAYYSDYRGQPRVGRCRQARLPLPGAALPVAAEAARHAGV